MSKPRQKLEWPQRIRAGGNALVAECAETWCALLRLASDNTYAIVAIGSIAVFCYGYELSHFSLSIDEELATLTSPDISAWVAQGRFGVALIKLVTGHVRVVPFFGLSLSLAFLVASAVVWWYTYEAVSGTRRQPSLLIAFGAMYVSCPSLPYYLSFDTFNLEVSCGFLLAALGTVFFVRNALLHKRPVNLVAGLVLVFASVSVYQSFLAVWIGGALFALIAFQLPRLGTPNRLGSALLIRYMAKCALVTATALLLYETVGAVLSLWIPKSPYVDSFVRWGTVPAATIATGVLKYAESFWSGASFWGASRLWITYLVAFGLLLYVLFQRREGKALVAVLIVALVLSPFLLVAVLGSGVPVRSLQAFPLMYAAVWLLALSVSDWSLVRRIVGVTIVFLVMLQAEDTNAMFFSEQLRWQADRSLAELMLDRIYMLDLPDESSIPVAFVGVLPVAPEKVFVKSEAFGASPFEWSDGLTWRVAAFLRIMGHQRLAAVTREQFAKAQVEARSMPVWPSPGSISYRGGMVIVKLSPSP